MDILCPGLSGYILLHYFSLDLLCLNLSCLLVVDVPYPAIVPPPDLAHLKKQNSVRENYKLIHFFISLIQTLCIFLGRQITLRTPMGNLNLEDLILKLTFLLSM